MTTDPQIIMWLGLLLGFCIGWAIARLQRERRKR
jgi:hypothetical protein